jgi:acetaldehyde dehydrogenase (acetylating)
MPSQAGTYDWVASYDGDSNNNGFTTSCGATNEEVTVNSPAGGQLAASTTSTTTPVTGADLFGPGLAGGLAIILGAMMIAVALRVRRLRSH